MSRQEIQDGIVYLSSQKAILDPETNGLAKNLEKLKSQLNEAKIELKNLKKPNLFQRLFNKNKRIYFKETYKEAKKKVERLNLQVLEGEKEIKNHYKEIANFEKKIIELKSLLSLDILGTGLTKAQEQLRDIKILQNKNLTLGRVRDDKFIQ